MDATEAPAHTDHEGWLIELHDGAQPSYFSTKVGRDQASPSGGWTFTKSTALAFARSIDAANFVKTFLPHMDGVAQVKLHTDLRRAA